MVKKNVTFVATQYKRKPVTVNFYTEKDGNVRFTATKKVPVRIHRQFRAKTK